MLPPVSQADSSQDQTTEHFLQGSWLHAQGRIREAIGEFRQVLAIDSLQSAPHLELARCYGEAGQPDSAFLAAATAARLAPDDPEPPTLAGLALLRVDRIQEGVEWLERARRMKPESATVLMNLLSALQQLRRPEDALSLIYPKMPASLDYPVMYQKRALLLFVAGKNREAAADLARALTQSPELPGGEEQLILILTRLSGPAERLPFLEEVSKGQPQLEKVRLRLGLSYMDAERWPEALPHLRTLAAVHPKETSLLLPLAITLERTGRVDSSLAVFDTLLSRSPDEALALNYAGYMCIERGIRLEEAMARVRRALDLDPDNAAYLDSYGWGCVRMGEPLKGVPPLQKAAAADSANVLILKHLAEAYDQVGEREAARDVWRRVLRLSPQDPEASGRLDVGPAPPEPPLAHPRQ